MHLLDTYSKYLDYLSTYLTRTGPSEGLKIRRCQYQCSGHNLPLLVEIGLTDLPKSGGTMAPPAPPGTTPLKDPTNFISQSSMASLFSSKGCDGSNTENGEVLQIVLRFTFLTRSDFLDFLIKIFLKSTKAQLSSRAPPGSNRSRKNWELSRQKGLL